MTKIPAQAQILEQVAHPVSSLPVHLQVAEISHRRLAADLHPDLCVLSLRVDHARIVE